MRFSFSIGFIVLLTMWAAMLVKLFTGVQEQRQLMIQTQRSLAETDSLKAQIQGLSAKRADKQRSELQAELSEYDELYRVLEERFAESSVSLGTLHPKMDHCSIRSIPVFRRPNEYRRAFAISVPDEQSIVLEVELFETNAGFDAEPIAVSTEIDGEHPVRIPLPTGAHTVEALFDQRTDKPYFSVMVDEKRIGKWTSYEQEDRGFLSSETIFRKQADYASTRRLPKLTSLAPGETSTEITVRLIRPDTPQTSTQSEVEHD